MPPQVVAFTDPNDLLSYPQVRSKPADTHRYRVVDVIVSNDWTWLGLLERPDRAHGWYDRTSTVLIGCGRGTADACTRP